ncbi:restriction endonuclease [Trueperella pyogenes]|uniref:restriction endonuclease n=1 Tax=Trueperella pyogenes TaxID=1661 RepID=UPI0024BF8D38|nr:restriction endonuclease [Trueperella pyogenes]WHU57325.1 restriction endonuclease [Trueperella pyogenes]
MDDIFDEPSRGRPIGADDVAATTNQIFESDHGQNWVAGGELDLGSKRWRPSAVARDGKGLLYVLLTDQLPRFVRERLSLAANQGVKPTLALNLASLYNSTIVDLLVAVDADVIVLDDYVTSRQLEPRPLLAALADLEVPVSPDVRRSIANVVWTRIGDGSAHQKGKRLEALLAFVFSQVHDLKVVERNYRNVTEEIDLVLQIDNFSSRIWQSLGVPFILVEAKNRSDRASQSMVSALITKLQTKRGSARIAFLVSLAGFTNDARLQELRFSTQEICVVMIDHAQLESILSADDMDEQLEVLVRQALLR